MMYWLAENLVPHVSGFNLFSMLPHAPFLRC